MGSGPVLVVLAAGRARRYGGVKPLAPVGPAGEAVIDLLGSDAMRAGFSTLVVVVGPETGPAIRYHVERAWPEWVDVHFASQEVPLGTAQAVLASTLHLAGDAPFGVANADDCYGVAGLTLLAEHLSGPDRAEANVVVAYRLRDAVIGTSPVSRGVCDVGDGALLRSLVERHQVTATTDGRFLVGDGKMPVELDGDILVSMNLWGFGPAIRDVLEAAMLERPSGPGSDDPTEVLLPDVVAQVLSDPSASGDPAFRFRVLAAPGRCVGVTHADDLPLVQRELAGQVGRGERSAVLWPTGA